MGSTVDSSTETYTGTYKWRINEFSQLTDREVTSTHFYVGNYKWCISFFPEGDIDREYVSVYLVCLSCKDFPSHQIQAQFRLTLVNYSDPKKNHSNRFENTFSFHDSNWGDPKFVPITKLKSNTNGFMIEDSVVFEAQVTVNQSKKNIVIEDTIDSVCQQLDILQLSLKDNGQNDVREDMKRAELLQSYANSLSVLTQLQLGKGGSSTPAPSLSTNKKGLPQM